MNRNGHVFGWHFPPGVTTLPGEGEQEPNPYTLCPDCGATHHEDEAHQCKGVYIRGSEVVQDWDQDEQDEQDYADMCEILDEEVDDV